jgi:hypothetical protein
MKGAFTSSATIGVTATQIVGSSYTRKRLIFHPPANNRVTISDSPAPALDAGPTLQQGQSPLVYDSAIDEELPTSPFFAIANVAGVVIGITEVHWDKAVHLDAAGRPTTQPVQQYPYQPFSLVGAQGGQAQVDGIR